MLFTGEAQKGARLRGGAASTTSCRAPRSAQSAGPCRAHRRKAPDRRWSCSSGRCRCRGGRPSKPTRTIESLMHQVSFAQADAGRLMEEHVMINDLRGKAVLITGGTMGIGLATGLAFARQGAHVHPDPQAGAPPMRTRSGSPSPRAAGRRRRSSRPTSPAPRTWTRFSSRSRASTSPSRRSSRTCRWRWWSRTWTTTSSARCSRASSTALGRCASTSAEIKKTFGQYPRYVVGLSSGGPDAYYKNYDFVAASKAVMETLCRYMSYRLFDEDIRINVVRSRLVRTESLRATFGQRLRGVRRALQHEAAVHPRGRGGQRHLGVCAAA